MATKNKLLTVLSEAEQYALYGLPDFDDGQRLDYLSLSEPELALASSRPSLCAKTYCALQIGYFKAKHLFFRFTWDEVPEDCAFVLTRYFNDQAFKPQALTKHEYYTQRVMIAELFGYRLWSADFLPQLTQQVAQRVRRDVTLGFIVAELIVYLNEHKIVRPGYTTLQTLISEALSAERRRLGELLAEGLDSAAKDALAQLLVRDDTLSELAVLKQDAKDFGWRQMARERRETRPARTAVPNGQDAAAQARDLATESQLLREPGQLLHGLRPTPPQGRTDSLVPAMLRLATLPAAYRQSRRRLGLPHEATGRREQGACEQTLHG
jgi:hypothetical protein